MTSLWLAIQFLTILPVRLRGDIRDTDLASSMRWYPLVGSALGAISAFSFWIALRLFSFPVAIVAAVVTLIVVSGALHLDGFADMCDGFYGGHDRERILAIMKDSRSGAMAIVGVFSLLSLKMSLLASQDESWILPSLVVAPTIGRWSMVWLCARSRNARASGGTASAYIGHVQKRDILIATIFCVAIAVALMSWRGLAAFVIAAAAAEVFRRYVERRLDGMTGDTLGACCELIEVLTLMSLAIRWMVFTR